MKTHSRYLLVIALVVAATQIGVLSSMILGRAAILRDGKQVLLEIKPVDPRDLLRGDYVRLGYAISSLPIELFEGLTPETEDPGSVDVFVRLSAGPDGLWHAKAARFGQPPAGEVADGEADIRGTTYLRYLGTNTKLVPVDYGIERFYLPEGEGLAIQHDIRERPFRMQVALDNDGIAQIKGFYDGDTLIFSEPLY